jgi:hypothetical protein
MRTISLAVLTGAVALLAAAPTSAATACGNVNGGFENTIRATGVSCSDARAVVRKWHRKAVKQAEGPETKYVGSFYCASRPTDPEHVKVNCASGTKKVRFFAGP